MASLSDPFIKRPVGTTLLAIGLFLVGGVAYNFLPVASIPSVDFPVIRVTASRPGADPSIMASTVAAPLERRLGEIAGIDQITSTSSLGSTNISLQFAIGRDIDRAARDVQAAINASLADLPTDLPTLPKFRKANPAASPVLIIALTSKTILPSAIYDIADTVVAQRISQVPGVGEASVSGADQPAVRIQINPGALATAGIASDAVRTAIVNANAIGPVGAFNGSNLGETIATNPQMRTAAQFKDIVIKNANGNTVRLSDVADVSDATRNSRSIAWFNKQPAVLIIITKQQDANVIETVDRVKALLPELKQWIPAGVDISILSDRTGTIRASVEDMQWTLAATAALVMLVVFVFLRRMTPTIAAGVSVPLALAGTCAGMWLAGFSINNLSLMALAISVGFVVDDAIVMIENMYRNLEEGMAPFQAALVGARQIGFTVLSISVSLVAAFTPLIFMDGIIGRLLREFSLTLTFAIMVSMVVSLTVTPMICAHYIKAGISPDATWFDRFVEGGLSRLVRFYERTLRVVLGFPFLTMLVFLATIALTVTLYAKSPKGYFPQDDSGLIIGSTRASSDVSFQAMLKLQQTVADIVMADPGVEGIGSITGGSGGPGGGSNRGRMFISLKDIGARDGKTTQEVIDRLRRNLSRVPGIRLFMFAAQDLRGGGRQSDSNYEYTLTSADLDLLAKWAPIVAKKMESVEGITDISSDRDAAGLAINLTIDRQAAASLGVKVQDIDNALNNAFSQRQISTIYTQRNQYQVIFEVDPRLQTDPTALQKIYVASTSGNQVPLSRLVKFEHGLTPLSVFHQASFPSNTISFNVLPDVVLQTATDNIRDAVTELHMPEGIRGDFSGNAADSQKTASRQPLLILGALIAVYIVLGVLYESLAHPLTIISTLPSAGLGALLALQLTNTPLTVIAFIGIILLIGIVKKNGIMIVDFALEGERHRGLSSEDAIFEASLARFRPILMTTMAALLAAVPLVIATGPGTELRRPLGITIIGGLIVSQILTLYTTPVIYLLIDRLRRRRDPAFEVKPGTCRIDIARRRLSRVKRVAEDAGEAYSPAMPSKLKPTEPAEEIPECAECGKPEPLCICESIEPIANRVELLILQHPQEQDRALGTARLTALQLKKSSLKIGLSWPSLSKALGRDVDPQRWAILYLGSVKVADLETDRDLVAVDRKGALEEGQRGILKDIEGVVLLDGTWSQAKALWWRNAWMLKCQRIVLGPQRPSLYGKLRKEPRADGLSTIEAAGMTLARLEGRAEIETALDKTFGRLLARYREVQTTMPELAPKPKKRDYRRPANRRGKSKAAT